MISSDYVYLYIVSINSHANESSVNNMKGSTLIFLVDYIYYYNFKSSLYTCMWRSFRPVSLIVSVY